jgi:pimeloyl-ACP methyl ester carboxylesterase
MFLICSNFTFSFVLFVLMFRYAPIALNIINYDCPEDYQRLSALQGLELIFTNVSHPEEHGSSISSGGNKNFSYIYALFGIDNRNSTHSTSLKSSSSSDHHHHHSSIHQQKEAIVAIRSLSSFNEMLLDVRNSSYCSFPLGKGGDIDGDAADEELIMKYISGEAAILTSLQGEGNKTDKDSEEMSVLTASMDDMSTSFKQNKRRYARKSIVTASLQLLSEVGPSLLRLSSTDYKITFVGHGYGGAIAALACAIYRSVMSSVASSASITAITFGCIPFIDDNSSERMKSFVLSVVLHDDVISRLSIQSCKRLVRELLLFRSKIFRSGKQSWSDVIEKSWQLSSSLSSLIPWKKNTATIEEAQHSQEKTERKIEETNIHKTEEEAGRKENLQQKELLLTITSLDDDNEALLVDHYEDNLKHPAIYLSGRILHLYFFRGQYHTSFIEKDHDELLLKIPCQSHLLQDHKCSSYMKALIELRSNSLKSSSSVNSTASSVIVAPPKWQSFDETTVCSCCNQRFSWFTNVIAEEKESETISMNPQMSPHHNSSSSHQQYLQRYNCRHCGKVVCDNCSNNYHSILKYGMIFPRRICDRCYLSGEYAMG